MRRNGDEAVLAPAQSPLTMSGTRECLRVFDWAATPLGPRVQWPAALQWSVDLVLAAGFPMAVRWGPKLITIYNDAYAPLLGERHPRVFGRPTREVWPEIYDRLGPLCHSILRGESGGFFAEDHPWLIQRYGVPEEARFTISYSPIPDAGAESGVGGILVTVFETTERVRNESTLRVLTTQLEAEVQQRIRERDRSWRWIAWTMTADAGQIYVAGRHISAEKEAAERLRASEQQLRSLMGGVVDYALIMLDPNGIVESWNAGAERIKGYAAEEIIGRHFSVVYTEEDRARGLANHSLTTAAAAGKFEAEAWRVRKDGSQFFAHVVIDAVRDEQGNLVGFAKITRDITERRNAQEALERTQAQLAQAQKMEALGQLTGGVAHDFNNLLMVVSGQAQALMRRLSDQKNIRSLEAILTAASRGEALTRQLLTFARRQT